MANIFDKIKNFFLNMKQRTRQNIIFSLLSIIGLMLIGLAVFYYYQGGKSFTTYTDTYEGIKVKYPSHWAVRKRFQGVVVAFISPREGKIDFFQDNVTIVVHDLTKKPTTLKLYSAKAIKQVMGVFKEGIAVLEDRPAIFAGRPGHKFVYQGKDPNNINLKMMHIWCLYGNKGYQLNFASTETDYDKYMETVEAMIKSFKITRRK